MYLLLAEQAVSTSMVYLIRSMGTVYGVAASSAIIQNVLSSRLPDALSGIPRKQKVISLPYVPTFVLLSSIG
jgi:hypothetical protein